VLLLIVWISVAVVALVILGSVLYGVAGAFQRLHREVTAAQREVLPAVQQIQQTLALVQERQRHDTAGSPERPEPDARPA
jgi:hypothetical protein